MKKRKYISIHLPFSWVTGCVPSRMASRAWTYNKFNWTGSLESIFWSEKKNFRLSNTVSDSSMPCSRRVFPMSTQLTKHIIFDHEYIFVSNSKILKTHFHHQFSISFSNSPFWHLFLFQQIFVAKSMFQFYCPANFHFVDLLPHEPNHILRDW